MTGAVIVFIMITIAVVGYAGIDHFGRFMDEAYRDTYRPAVKRKNRPH